MYLHAWALFGNCGERLNMYIAEQSNLESSTEESVIFIIHIFDSIQRNSIL